MFQLRARARGGRNWSVLMAAAMTVVVRRIETYPRELVIPVERTEKGTRFGIMTRAANAIYFNVPKYLGRSEPFLDPVSKDKHILKDYLYAMLGCDENLACLRARCILDDKFTEPILFFAASKELTDQDGNEWSVCDLAPIVDMTVAALETGITTPATWMEEAYDIFAAVTHEAYATWKAARRAARAVCRRQDAVLRSARAPARDPRAGGNDEGAVTGDDPGGLGRLVHRHARDAQERQRRALPQRWRRLWRGRADDRDEGAVQGHVRPHACPPPATPVSF